MKRILILAGTLALVLGSLASTPVLAAAETNTSSGLTLQGPGLAVRGYDVVAYFTDGRPTAGSAGNAVVHDGATYRFATAENAETFARNPDRYIPQYGGYCAYGVAVGAKFDADPLLWRVVDNRLFLNLNESVQKTWEEDVAGNIRKADRNWSEISNKTPAELK